MTMVRVPASPAVLYWARHRVGVDTRRVEAAFTVEEWERGERLPTLKQLQAYAKATHTPVGTFFLSAPPTDELPIADFRTIRDERIQRPSTNLLQTIETCQLRQDWYRRYAVEDDAEPVAFVGSARVGDDVVATATRVRHYVGLDVADRAAMPRWADAFRAFVQGVEDAGVLVMVSGVVGSNAHRPLDPDEFRGFALADVIAPLIFVNGRSTTSAKTFTLAHELAHLAIGESGIDAAVVDAPIRPGVPDLERWCNEFAAELLVPIADLAERRSVAVEDPITGANDLARRYKVSTLVVLRRMWDARWFDSWAAYREAYEAEAERLAANDRTPSSGGSFHRTQAARLGRRFASAIAASVAEGKTPIREAMRLTATKSPASFDAFARELGVGT